MSDKPKFPRVDALCVTRLLLSQLAGCTQRVLVAGSLRRGKLLVGDIEILFIPKVEPRPDPQDMLGATIPVDLADAAIALMLARGEIRQRKNSKDAPTWGNSMKFAVHDETGIPIDFFIASEANWWNLVVCRTGPKESNIAIAAAAKRIGWKWQPYTDGFTKPTDHRIDTRTMHCEADVFRFVGLPFLPPEKR